MQSNLIALVRHYIWASYRRKTIDRLLTESRDQFHGIVLDIGGRDRGQFHKPKELVDRWIFADINPAHTPDLVIDVADMKEVGTASIDTICACELFEHVQHIEQGLDECVRVLKPGGTFLMSVPFLYAVHADPSDYQRWTKYKWRDELDKRNLRIEKFIVMGRFFTIVSDYTKTFFKALPKPFHWLVIILCPFLDLVVKLDSLPRIQKHPLLGKFHGGYFMIIRKNV